LPQKLKINISEKNKNNIFERAAIWSEEKTTSAKDLNFERLQEMKIR
jgi:hypothetical protein